SMGLVERLCRRSRCRAVQRSLMLARRDAGVRGCRARYSIEKGALMLTRPVVRSLPLFLVPLWPATGSAANEVPFTHVIVDGTGRTEPHCKSVGDLKGDGSPDIAVASAAGDGLVWYSYPLWSRCLIAPGSFTTDMQVADLDSDLDLDLVTFDKDAQ